MVTMVTMVILRSFRRNLGQPFGEISGETSQDGTERERNVAFEMSQAQVLICILHEQIISQT